MVTESAANPLEALTWQDIEVRASVVASQIFQTLNERRAGRVNRLLIYPVPRGGIPAAQAVLAAWNNIPMSGKLQMAITDSPRRAHVIIDDIIDSGETRLRHEIYGVPFYALIDKTETETPDPMWYVFPWERMVNEAGPEENIRRIIEFIGDDPNRNGLKETPSRVVRSYAELFSGYKADLSTVFKTFDDIPYDEMIVLRDIDFYSNCEHHMLPFFGKVHIAYIPNGPKVIGLSKMARLVEVFARRLQVQERLTHQIADALDEGLVPLGCACIIQAKHFCMMCRGAHQQNAVMETSALRGVMRDKPEARMELLALTRSR
jgi:GTP cyclohydrolase I